VLTIADDLHARGTGVKILTGKLSGTCPTGEGKFCSTMMAAFAELERQYDSDRERRCCGCWSWPSGSPRSKNA
jgi:DNA invertase Pin-like site-specific DNA recombinase